MPPWPRSRALAMRTHEAEPRMASWEAAPARVRPGPQGRGWQAAKTPATSDAPVGIPSRPPAPAEEAAAAMVSLAATKGRPSVAAIKERCGLEGARGRRRPLLSARDAESLQSLPAEPLCESQFWGSNSRVSEQHDVHDCELALPTSGRGGQAQIRCTALGVCVAVRLSRSRRCYRNSGYNRPNAGLRTRAMLLSD